MFVAVIFLFLIDCVKSDSPKVSTEYGEIHGFRYETSKGFKADVFLGIPFTQPPIGDLRFEKPRPVSPWASPLNATSYGSPCATHIEFISTHTSEDCLTLNVFKPANPSDDPRGYPVMVFIHGGGFMLGSSADYDYKEIIEKLVSRGIIIISINYRLGPFGFFSTGTSDAPGNYGLWDQIEALKFIQKTVKNFGGNPSNLTISGISAGGASVSWLTLSPAVKDIFSRAIVMSGSALAPASANEAPVKCSVMLLNETQCLGVKNPKECLKGKSITEINEALKKIFPFFKSDTLDFLNFHPRFDGDFVKATNIEDAIKDAPKKENFIGICRQEFSVLALNTAYGDPSAKHMPFPVAKAANYSREDLIAAVEHILTPAFGSKSAAATKKITEFYESQRKYYSKNVYLQIYAQLFSDLLFNIPPMREATLKALSGHDVYFYVFDFVADEVKQEFFEHAGHAGEHIYVVGQMIGLPAPDWMNADVAKVQNIFANLFVNFAKTGIPSSGKLIAKKVEGESSLPFVNVSVEAKVGNNLWQDRVAFWNEMAESYGFDWPQSRRTISHNEL